jgi:hypothetical protein
MKRKEAMDVAKYSDGSSIRREALVQLGICMKKWSQVTVLSDGMSYTYYNYYYDVIRLTIC